MRDSFKRLNEEVMECRGCPRLVDHREHVARTKRRAYLDQEYWGRPVPGFGRADARVVLVGLAPGAHGSNRTGRVFTGDASGNFLYPALHRFGFASQPDATGRNDGLKLIDAYITAVARCAPPGNKPTRDEIARCHDYLLRELRLLRRARIYVGLGKIGFDGLARALAEIDKPPEPLRPRFAHAARFPLANEQGWLVGTYHPSQQNTQTGRLTQTMFDGLFRDVRELAGLPATGA